MRMKENSYTESVKLSIITLALSIFKIILSPIFSAVFVNVWGHVCDLVLK